MPGSKNMDLAKLAAQNRMKRATEQIEATQPVAPQQNAPSSSSTAEKPQISRQSSRTSGLSTDFKPLTLKQLLGRLDTERSELQNRKSIAKGISANAKACEAHVNGLKSLKEIQKRGEGAKLKIIFAKNPTIMDLTIATDTALMPLCYQCFVKETGHDHGDPLPSLDACACASKVLSAECVYCAVGELEQKKLAAVQDRTKTTTQGAVVIVCQCGSIVQGTPKARKCACCDGVVTEPFTNFAGEAVTFVPHSAAVEKEPNVKSSTQRLTDGILDTLTPALLMTRVTGTLIAAENDSWLLEEAHDRVDPTRIEQRKANHRLEFSKSVASLADHATVPYLRLREIAKGLKGRAKGIDMEDLKSIWRTCSFGIVDRDRFEEFVNRRWGGKVEGRDLVLVVKAVMDGASV